MFNMIFIASALGGDRKVWFRKNSEKKNLDNDSEKSDKDKLLKVNRKFDPRLARRSVEETIEEDKKIQVNKRSMKLLFSILMLCLGKFQKPIGRGT
jgi:hypothetical protein